MILLATNTPEDHLFYFQALGVISSGIWTTDQMIIGNLKLLKSKILNDTTSYNDTQI